MLFTGTLFLGAFLAGLGGALQIPRSPANTGMDLSIIAECFVVTVVGGMGSVPGAFLAALIIGQLQAFGILIFPKITLVRRVPADGGGAGGAALWLLRPPRERRRRRTAVGIAQPRPSARSRARACGARRSQRSWPLPARRRRLSR